MNPVLKCDAERRALLMDYDLPKIMMTDANELARTNSGNYGSIVVDHWYLREVPNKPQDSSDSSSTCCSSSSEEDATSIIRSNEVTVMLSDHEDSTQEDKQHKHHATSKVGNILTYQNSSLTASTCSNTSYSEYDSDDVEMGERDVSEFTTVDHLIVKEESSRPELRLTFPGWEAYNKSLDEYPVTTKAFTSLTGWLLGDLVTQTVITGGPFDFHRSIVLASFGFFFHGPAGHVIYDNLDKLIDGKGPKEIAAKIMVDQILWCPIFMICYFTYLGLANGELPAAIIAKIHSELWTAVQGSWKVWILAHAIQFRYVATKHRIVYINCVEVCFVMFLSFLGNS